MDSDSKALDVHTFETPDDSSFRDFYPVNPPYGYVGIEVDENTGRLLYRVVEPSMEDNEQWILKEIKDSIIEQMDIPVSLFDDREKMENYLKEQADEVFQRLKKKVAIESEEKYLYYLQRDFLGYGQLDLLMLDPKIEDISCNGLDTPIYVWHREFESIPSNVIYSSDQELNRIVTRLAYKTGHQISIARPLVEGTLPEGHRVQLTLEEVSKRGKTFTIRKFRHNPFTIIDLINFGTISPQIAAYLWVLVDNLRSIMVCGATASGKTALLNSISMFVNPEMKVVTIEEVRELRLHENWVPMVTRPSYQPGVEEVTLFDLLKSALRQRPDYIIVGEVRGEEAYTLFQSIAVGHGGLCTIHADSIKSVIKRLLSRPMNIPEMMLPLMNVIIQIGRVKLDDKILRRVKQVAEITSSPVSSATQTAEIVELKTRFEWDPETDDFIFHEPSDIDQLLDDSKDIYTIISETQHIPIEKIVEEQNRREIILKWMIEKNIKSYQEVAEIVRNYYADPEKVFNEARLGVL
jgi:flagellar protein FlaI